MEATGLPVIAIALATLISFSLAGIYGIAVAALSMLSMAGIVVAIDAFGPVTDNAGGIAEMAGLPAEVRVRHRRARRRRQHHQGRHQGLRDRLGRAGRGRALRRLHARHHRADRRTRAELVFNLSNPYVLVGLFIGGSLPFLFASLAMTAVGKAAGAVVEEVRRQFREIPGIMEGTAQAGLRPLVDLVTQAALQRDDASRAHPDRRSGAHHRPRLHPQGLRLRQRLRVHGARCSVARSSAPSSPACSSPSR